MDKSCGSDRLLRGSTLAFRRISITYSPRGVDGERSRRNSKLRPGPGCWGREAYQCRRDRRESSRRRGPLPVHRRTHLSKRAQIVLPASRDPIERSRRSSGVTQPVRDRQGQPSTCIRRAGCDRRPVRGRRCRSRLRRTTTGRPSRVERVTPRTRTNYELWGNHGTTSPVHPPQAGGRARAPLRPEVGERMRGAGGRSEGETLEEITDGHQ